MFARLILAVPLGVGVTVGLFLLMQHLVITGRAALGDPPAFKVGNVKLVGRDEQVETKAREPVKPPAPKPMPERPQPDGARTRDRAPAVSVSAPAVRVKVKRNRLRFGNSDGEFLPIVKVAPVYPAGALAKRLEGYVLVEFVVTPAGAVKDVVVLESTADVFERPAIEAALEFKYRPRIVDGVPVEVRGVRNKIVFEMEAEACTGC